MNKHERELIVIFLENIEINSIKNENGTDLDWDLFEEHLINNETIKSFRIVSSEDYDLSTRYVNDI